MGQDSWNLQYGHEKPAKYRRGTSVDMHADEGYGGPKMVPGYAGAYKNSKTKVTGLKANGNPRTYGSDSKKSVRSANESWATPQKSTKRRK